MKDHFHFSPEILKRLGEELVPNIDQGLIEIAKNSYDADADWCSIKLFDVKEPGGSIVIKDNGIGMEREDITNGWLVLGSSGKKEDKNTPIYKRLKVGSKGLGRLAALRQGNKVLLETVPKGKNNFLSMEICWEDFEKAHFVEEVAFDIREKETQKRPGTRITIDNLHEKISKKQVEKLANSLLLMSGPFRDLTNFKVNLESNNYSDIEYKVENSFFHESEYFLRGEIGEDGLGKAYAEDYSGNLVWDTVFERPYNTVPITFEIWIYVLNKQTFSTRDSTIKEVRNWLSYVGGVHIFENGIRVPPYGGVEGYDWLDINLMRARSPEERPSTNTVIGRVLLNDVDGYLVQKTDRSGYQENEHFEEIKQFCKDCLDWLAKKRLSYAEKIRREKKEKLNTKESKEKLNSMVDSYVPKQYEDKAKEAINKVITKEEKEKDSLRDELELYRSLATAGMNSAVFAHESEKPLRIIKRITDKFPEKEDRVSYLDKNLPILKKAEFRLSNYVELIISLLRKEKRRRKKIDVKETLEDMLDTFDSLLSEYSIGIVREIDYKDFSIFGSKSLIEGVISNLLSNGVNAFNREEYNTPNRKIKISTTVSEEVGNIFYEDNAGGIDFQDLDDIWLPGYSTRSDGTGLGLTIVKDSVSDLGGNVKVYPKTEFGGAGFSITLPIL